ncbi:hypothetical protein BV22DRAFT_97206 [Leucogyrophana mollusca]|uniref:Uncharacterized protein n=1 Tax=Leucogyrophana mollusca TaxID=85980 RepID=A0ACB8BWE9_9AGAM|nr:hypothetical protein BV22DRAFT_97206 [Leucogyrophana mollusca]
MMCDTGYADTMGCDGDTTTGDGEMTECGDETSSSRRATPEPKPDRPPHPISSRSNAGTKKDAERAALQNPEGDPVTSVPDAKDSCITPPPHAPPPRTPTPKSTVSRTPKPPAFSLPKPLTHASTLLHTFPPTHPALEDLVTHLELVVVPYVEPTPKPQRALQPRKKAQLRLRLPLATVHLQRRMIIAVLVLGVAVYGARAGRQGGGAARSGWSMGGSWMGSGRGSWVDYGRGL